MVSMCDLVLYRVKPATFHRVGNRVSGPFRFTAVLPLCFAVRFWYVSGLALGLGHCVLLLELLDKLNISEQPSGVNVYFEHRGLITP